MIEVHGNTPPNQAQSSAPLTHRTSKAIEAAKTAATKQTPAVSEQDLDRVFREQIPELRASANAKLQLDIDQVSGEVVGRIIDKTSGETIKQIPSEDMLRLISRTKELLGALYDNSV